MIRHWGVNVPVESLCLDSTCEASITPAQCFHVRTWLQPLKLHTPLSKLTLTSANQEMLIQTKVSFVITPMTSDTAAETHPPPHPQPSST